MALRVWQWLSPVNCLPSLKRNSSWKQAWHVFYGYIDQVGHQFTDFTGCEMLSRCGIGSLIETSQQILKHIAHRNGWNFFRTQFNFRIIEFFNQSESNTRFLKTFKLISKLKFRDNILHIFTKTVKIKLMMGWRLWCVLKGMVFQRRGKCGGKGWKECFDYCLR